MSEQNNSVASQKQSKGRNMLLMLAVIFILPFTIAATLHILDIRPSGKSFGNLIAPPIALEIPELIDVHGKAFSAEKWGKKWNVVMIGHNGCDRECQDKLDMVNRMHISLAKEAKRVQRLLILPPSDKDFRLDIHSQFPNLQILTGATEQYISVFETAAPEPSIYLVDPLGNLMMQYPLDVSPKNLRGDLVRLLKNSWGG